LKGVLVHVRLDPALLEALDREAAAEGRSRSAVVAGALKEYLRRRRLLRTIAAGAASLSPEEAAYWGSPEAADAWVRAFRSAWERPR
jgi:predicted transcriptional regulator